MSTNVDAHQESLPRPPFTILHHLLPNQAQMLAFLFQAEYQIVYETFELKHAPYLERKIEQSGKRKKGEEIQLHLKALSAKLHERILREDIECDRALSKVQFLWEGRGIQYFHRFYVQKYLYSAHLKNLKQLIHNQDNLIRQQQHIYFSILRTIEGREACLRKIKRQLSQMGAQSVYQHFHVIRGREEQARRRQEQQKYRIHGYRVRMRMDEHERNLGVTKMQQLRGQIFDLSKLSVHVIELILRWKVYLCSLTHDIKKRRERIQFYFREQNYMLKMLSDTSFIHGSFLANFYTFSKNDPFFIKPTLTIERRQHQTNDYTFEDEELKKVFMHNSDDLGEVLCKIQELFIEYQNNIKSRKFYDLKGRNRGISVDKLLTNQSQKLLISKLQPARKGIETVKKPLLVNIPLSRSNVILKKVKMEPIKTMSNFKNENPQMFDSNILRIVKEEIVRKVRSELQGQKKILLEGPKFKQFIDDQVRMKLVQLDQERKTKSKHLIINPFSISEQDFLPFVHCLYKNIPSWCLKLQKDQAELIKQLKQKQMCYFMSVQNEGMIIGHVAATIDKQNDLKIIKVEFVSFLNPDNLESIILKFVDFIWKYDNAFEVVFTLDSSNANQEAKGIANRTKIALKQNCTIGEKGEEIKLIFRRKGRNTRYVQNLFPHSFHFKLYLLMAQHTLKVETSGDGQGLIYDYLLMEILRKYTTSQHFLILRDTFRPKDRLKRLLQMLMDVENNPNTYEKIVTFEAQNVSELNRKLAIQKKPFLDISDLTKANNLKLLCLEMTLNVAFQHKAVTMSDGAKYYRYSILSHLQIIKSSIVYYCLPLQHKADIQLIVFESRGNFNKNIQEIIKGEHKKTEIGHLWIEMCKYPSESGERQSRYLSSWESGDLKSLGEQVVIGDCGEWFCDLTLQNGISYKIEAEDTVLRKPLGVAVLQNGKSLIYAKILN